MSKLLATTDSLPELKKARPGQHWHLAQMNIARSLAPLDSPVMASFLELVPILNALAEQSPGFVWRLKTSDQIPANEGAYADPLVIVNLSVWTGIAPLLAYFNCELHQAAYRRRLEWFEPSPHRQGVLWWTPSGTLPTVADGKRRLCLLNERGETVEAFSFTRVFPPPGSEG
jgi:hypothetical protein